MSKTEYQADVGRESKRAKALITNANISLKYSTEICNQIKGQMVNKMIAWLQRIEKHEDYLPLKRYRRRIGHRKGNAMNGTKTGRFPEMTVRVFVELLELAKNNADFKGLDAEKLIILNAFASKGITRMSYQPKGRISGKARRANATHIEVIVQETK